MFTVLDSPRVVAKGARSLSLRVASTLPARLAVSGLGVQAAHLQVGERPRRLRVPVAGRIQLRLELVLKADGKVTRFELPIDRR
jgi:hypothetical protein